MKSWLLLVVAQVSFLAAYAQHTLQVTILDAETQESLVGATAVLSPSDKGSSSDIDGTILLENILAGNYNLTISYIGYEAVKQRISIPNDSVLTVYLHLSEEELEEIVVTTTRSSRLIDDIPTRMEAITEEELIEKAMMNSTNISMILQESTGIQMQQTSASSANKSIRIQGLDGRYTQILRDGFPLYSGFSSGLSIMQIPPLDLKQVEVIKGSASTLYGGGAIAGLINLISRTPSDEPVLDMMFTQTHALGSTLNAFYAQQLDRIGVTLYTSGNYQSLYDPDDNDFSDLPQVKSLSINPAFYFNFDETSRLKVGLNTTFEERIGGDITAIEKGSNPEHLFTEENNSTRYSSQIQFDKQFSKQANLSVKNSMSYFDRTLSVLDYQFQGKQLASFSEVSYSIQKNGTDWIFGANLWTEDFAEVAHAATQVLDYQHNTVGIFAQNTYPLGEAVTVETGLRTDFNTDYGFFVLPRISLLWEVSESWTTRLGGGLGYKTPTIFTEESEALFFRGILPINQENIEAERSIGLNWDVNYKTILFDQISLSINNLLFYTRLNNPLVLNNLGNKTFGFDNADGVVDSKGIETNVKFSYKDWRLFFNYAYINAELDYNGLERQKPLTPQHNIGAVLMFEGEKWRLGYELYYTGRQFISDFSEVQDYWVMGFLAMRTLGPVHIFVNFENFTDTRQTRFDEVVLPPHNAPIFQEIWAPTDGFIFSAGVRLNLFDL